MEKENEDDPRVLLRRSHSLWHGLGDGGIKRIRPKKKGTMFSIRSDIQKWCGDAGVVFFWGGGGVADTRADRTMYSHTYKGCFRLNKMFDPVEQGKLAVGGGKMSDAWGSN